MTIRTQPVGDTIWHLYDPADGTPNSDGADRGYVMLGEDGRYALHGRGDMAPLLGHFATLDQAISAAR